MVLVMPWLEPKEQAGGGAVSSGGIKVFIIRRLYGDKVTMTTYVATNQ